MVGLLFAYCQGCELREIGTLIVGAQIVPCAAGVSESARGALNARSLVVAVLAVLAVLAVFGQLAGCSVARGLARGPHPWDAA